MSDFNHISLSGRTISLPYSTFGRGSFVKRDGLNREGHGSRLRDELDDAVNEFSEGDLDYDFVFIDFDSAIDFELDIDKFENSKGDIRLVSCKRIKSVDQAGVEHIIYKAAVYLRKKQVNQFLKKIDQYINENTTTGNPKNESLLANIDSIKRATLESFWQEIELDFPDVNEDIWWEVWFNKSEESAYNFLETIQSELSNYQLNVGNRVLDFPEHFIVLIKGTASELSSTLLYNENLSELRKPSETADFFTELNRDWETDVINDLQNRLIIDTSNISVCLLDTGVNRVNPLLERLIPERNLDSINPSWTNADSYPNGHGTPMAGLIFYGDMIEPLSSTENIRIFHSLESIKILENSDPNDPDLYGQITIEAVSRAEILNPENKRIVCLAVTAPNVKHEGRPTSWSSAIDKMLCGLEGDPNNRTLILVSGGNVPLENRLEYPLVNHDISVNDPAQSFNSITIGSFTLKDGIDYQNYPGAELLAKRGEMAPCNTTSISWSKEWARKPDIVMEGGNDGIFDNSLFDPDSLKLLSAGVGGLGRSWLTTFGDTSGSAALASKFIAELYQHYPHYWPETIRALVVHSAEWTTQMLGNRSINNLTANDQKRLISSVGYGVPNFSKARYSEENSLTLIAERTIQPYQKTDRIKTNEFHLFDLPWPAQVLLELGETQVIFKLTLSYFIEPNPGNKKYATAANYRSCGLRFKMIDRNESDKAFKARISKSIREETKGYRQEGSENWVLGSEVRDKGSIHKDIWIGNAADLATKNKIGVFPVGGWWKTRKKLERYSDSIRYSLIATIETPEISMDVYNPELTEILISV
ncbi:MAG: hypothetical protein ACI8TA_000695 [Cyclobacteriaceae bacterium]|jgi:hypothetical protein